MRVDVFPLALLLPLATCLPHPRPFQTDSKDPGSDNGQTAPAPDLVKWGLGFLGIGATSWALVERQQRRRVQQQLAAAEARLRTPIEPPASAPIDAVADDAAAADAADAVAAVSPPSPALTLDVGHSWVQSWLQSDPEVEQCMIEELGDIVPVDDVSRAPSLPFPWVIYFLPLLSQKHTLDTCFHLFFLPSDYATFLLYLPLRLRCVHFLISPAYPNQTLYFEYLELNPVAAKIHHCEEDSVARRSEALRVPPRKAPAPFVVRGVDDLRHAQAAAGTTIARRLGILAEQQGRVRHGQRGAAASLAHGQGQHRLQPRFGRGRRLSHCRQRVENDGVSAAAPHGGEITCLLIWRRQGRG